MVPEAEFRSYYDRPVVKAAPWKVDIPAYLFLGGLAGGSSLLAAGADLTGRSRLRRTSRVTALGAVSAGLAALVHDLGRPARFHHMLRMAKPTSPMSMGTWLLTGYAPLAALAAAGEAGRHLPGSSAQWDRAARPAGLAAAALAPAVAAYTAVLLSHTAIPTWHGARRGLPFVFVGSAAAAAGGAALVSTPLDEAAPARRLAVGGAVVELVATRRLEATMGLLAEPFGQGPAGRYQRAARALGVLGAGAAVLGCRHRAGSVAAGAALVAGSWCTRAAVFHAGQQSAEDPRYTVVPQRQRLDERRAARAGAGAGPEPHG